MRVAGERYGFSLIELTVVLAISFFVGAALLELVRYGVEWERHYSEGIAIQKARSLVQSRLTCGVPCNQVRSNLPKVVGTLNISVQCNNWYDDFVVFYESDLTERGVLFDVANGSPCAARKQPCADACHNRGILVERGYFFPPIGEAYDSQPDGRCLDGDEVIGVDFSLQRVICGKRTPVVAGGGQGSAAGMCAEFRYLDALPDATLTIVLKGEEVCSNYTSVNVWDARLDDVKLVVVLEDGFVPSEDHEFTIVNAHSLSGEFSNAEDNIDVGDGRFDVRYDSGKVVLHGYSGD